MNPNSFVLDTLRFGSLWAVGITALSLSAIRRQQYIPPPSGQTAAVHLTLVARLPQQASIDEFLSELKRRDPSHHYYSTDTIHMTIRNFDSIKDVDRSQLLAQLQHCIGSTRPFSLRARGLGVSPNSVFLQLFPEDRSLWELRQKLSLLTQDDSRTRKRVTDSSLFRDLLFHRLAFANLNRFSGPISLPFIREIARHRTTNFGSFCVEALELVQTDKLFSDAGTTIIDRISLTR